MLIAQLTDLHVRPLGRAANRVVETTMLTERAFRAVASRPPLPDVVLLTGDLTECGSAAEYGILADMMRRILALPVFVIPGNHDQREAMIAHLPGTRTEDGFVQYAIEEFPVRLVMLDTAVAGAPHGELCSRRLAWLDRTLAADPMKPTLIAMHHPPFAIGIGHMDRIALREPANFVALLGRHKQVQRIVCGHHHRSITARVGDAVASIAPSVAHQVELDLRPDAPPAFMLEPPAYQLHCWSEQDGFVTHTAFVENYPGPFPFLLNTCEPGAEP
ncbi:MAG: phosphodiesterase [Pseudomonadota bacterium]|nr:phosphodiesterase [Pseudomonadota bacterium]